MLTSTTPHRTRVSTALAALVLGPTVGLALGACSSPEGAEAVTCGQYLDYTAEEKRTYLKDMAKTDALPDETKKQIEESDDTVLDLVAVTLDGACQEADEDDRVAELE